MKELRMVSEPYASSSLKEVINEGIALHNVARTGMDAYFPVAFFIRDENDGVLGGVIGDIWGGWLHVSLLWVAELIRGKGWGERLLLAAEQYAIERGCIGSFLDTFSFQARPFYEKFGYEVFGTLEDHPRGHRHFFLKKGLHPS
jgi:GNAT superfamily N-acetyltransferase